MFVVSFLYLLSRWIMFVYFENSFQRADKASALTPQNGRPCFFSTLKKNCAISRHVSDTWDAKPLVLCVV